jgi:hypothetical protein
MTKYSTRSDKISSNKLHRRPPITVAVSVDTLLAFSSQPVSLYILHTINLNLSFDIPSFDSQPSSQGDHVWDVVHCGWPNGQHCFLILFFHAPCMQVRTRYTCPPAWYTISKINEKVCHSWEISTTIGRFLTSRRTLSMKMMLLEAIWALTCCFSSLFRNEHLECFHKFLVKPIFSFHLFFENVLYRDFNIIHG